MWWWWANVRNQVLRWEEWGARHRGSTYRRDTNRGPTCYTRGWATYHSNTRRRTHHSWHSATNPNW